MGESPLLVIITGMKTTVPGGPSLALHGGSGTLLRNDFTPELEEAYRHALASALGRGWKLLESGAAALEVVQAVVVELEECPLFNAGRGSVFTAEGRHEMDAAVMRGSDRRAGAVAGVAGVRNPVLLARAVLEDGRHVLLGGGGAEAFARTQGLEFAAPEFFATELRRRQLEAALRERATVMDHDLPASKFGTVGAVACDREGHVAAATSTGGLTGKRFGRIGDSPLIGAGTYAWDATCAVSCTGYGEEFMRGLAAYDVSARTTGPGGGNGHPPAADRPGGARRPDCGGPAGSFESFFQYRRDVSRLAKRP